MGDIYCIMNHKKVKCSDKINGLQAEANREYEDESRYFNNVDLNMSYQNVTLVHSDDWKKSINDIIEKAGVSVKKDSVLAISTVYTASPEWFENHPDKQEQLAYFEDCLAFHKQRFGEVFSAVIHYDETTPHMQLVSVPIIETPKFENYWICKADGKEVKPDDVERWGKKEDRKRKQRKILDENGKPVTSVGLNGGYALGNKTKLSNLQTEFAEQVGKLHGMERGKCRIDSDEQVERKTALQHEIEEMEVQKEELEKAVEDTKVKIAEEREKLTAEKKESGELKSAAEEQLIRAAKRNREAEALKGVYEQKSKELDKLLPEVKKFVNEPPAVSEDADYSRKAFMESLKMPNGISAEKAYQMKLAREQNAEADKKAKADTLVKKSEQIREPSKQDSPLAKVLRTAKDITEQESSSDKEYSL